MSVGKRYNTTEPLTEHDVADRLEKAMLRVWRIMVDARQMEGEVGTYPNLMDAVKSSRYLTNVPMALMWELERWGYFPQCASKEQEEVDV